MLRSPNRVGALVVGAALLVLGVAGIVSTVTHPASREEVLGLFAANLPQALVHTALGVWLVVASFAGLGPARFAAQLGGTILLALGIAGLFLVDSAVNVLALGASDNLAHFIGAVILLTFGFGTEQPAKARAG